MSKASESIITPITNGEQHLFDNKALVQTIKRLTNDFTN